MFYLIKHIIGWDAFTFFYAFASDRYTQFGSEFTPLVSPGLGYKRNFLILCNIDSD